jgi:hypothetical protein
MKPITDHTLSEPVVITTETGQAYRAELEEGFVTVSYEKNERWLRAGEGAWDGCIVDCDADLGKDAYDLLNEAIAGALAG